MKLKVLIDEDLHRSIKEIFQKLEFTVFDVRDVGLRGRSDQAIFNWAQKKNAIIVSADLDFANEVDFPEHKGIIILRFPNEMPTQAINQEVKRLLKDFQERDYQNHLIIVSPGKVRIRELTTF